MRNGGRPHPRSIFRLPVTRRPRDLSGQGARRALALAAGLSAAAEPPIPAMTPRAETTPLYNQLGDGEQLPAAMVQDRRNGFSLRIRSKDQLITAKTSQLIPHAHLFAAYIAMWRRRIWKRRPRFNHFVYRAAVTSVFALEPVAKQVCETPRKRSFGHRGCPKR